MNLNHFTISGNVTRDLELRHLPSGMPSVTYRRAVGKRRPSSRPRVPFACRPKNNMNITNGGLNAGHEDHDTIEASAVPDDQRIGTLPHHFGSKLLHAEILVYGWMGRLCTSYTGGYWPFYRLSNGGFFMAPRGDKPWRIEVETNGYEGSMSAQAAGITACLFAFNQLANADGREQDRFIELYHQLRDFVGFHEEASEIFQSID